jgi:hypothetical protein
MKTNESIKPNKAEQAATKHFQQFDHIQNLAVIDKQETEAHVLIFSRDEGMRLTVDFPLTYDLEYAAQCLLRRFDVVTKTIVYA